MELNASRLGAALDGLLDAGRLAPDNPKLLVNLGAALFNATIPLAIWLAVASVLLFLSDSDALPGWSTRALGGLVLLVGVAMCWPGVLVTTATGVAALAALMWPVAAAYGGLAYLARAKRLASRP